MLKLRHYQKQALQFVLMQDDGALLAMEMRLGKTRVAIAAAQQWLKMGVIDLVLVICPKSVINHEIWQKELSSVITTPYRVFTHNAKRRQSIWRCAGTQGTPWVIVAQEGISAGGLTKSTLMQELKRVTAKRYAVIVDESHRIKTPSTKLYRACMWLSKRAERRLALTGTPMTINHFDLYCQLNFVSSTVWREKTWSAFKDNYAIMGGFRNKKIVGLRNPDDFFRRAASKTVVHRRTDVAKWLDTKTRSIVNYSMSPAQTTAYEQVLNQNSHYCADLFKGTVTAVTIMAKLIQITSGYVILADGSIRELVSVDKDNKLSAVVDTTEQAKNAVVWYDLVEQGERLARALPDAFFIKASMSADARRKTISAYKSSSDRVLVTSVNLTAEGLSFSECKVALFTNVTTNLAKRLQAEDRIVGTGGALILDLVGSQVDKKLLGLFNNKKTLDERLASVLLREMRDDH